MLNVAATTCPGPYTITVTASGTINLTSVLPDITRNITFIGPGASNLTVRRNSATSFRIFTITGSGTVVSFDGFAVADGATVNGGGFNNAGKLTISNCILRINQSTNQGGGIFNTNQLIVANTLFESNTALNGGAGIYNQGGSSTLTSCTLTTNQASYGGAISNLGNHQATLSNCVVQSNTATSNGFIGGGGILNNNTNSTLTTNQASYGGAISNLGNHQTTLSNCVVQSNTATSNGFIGGGGILNNNTNSTLTSCTLTGNQANYGGGIYNVSSTAILSNFLVYNNTALTFGGGIYSDESSCTLVNGSFENNAANSQGGAMFVGTGNYVLANASFRGNSATTGSVFYLYSAGATVQLTNGVLFGNGAVNNVIGNQTLQATYSLFEQNTARITASPSNLTTTVSPFANPTGTQLAACAPAINGGSNAAFTGVSSLTTDLAGNDRFFNTTIDMGAYEFQGDGLPASFAVLGSGTATCSASPTITLSGSETGVSYQLQRNGVNSVTAVAGTGSSLSFGSQPQSGTYTVVATRAGNACTLVMPTSATIVSNTAAPTVSLSATSGTLTCGVTSVTLTATTAETALLWSNGATAKSLTVNTSGTYAVTVTNAGGCTAVSNSLTISQNTTSPTSPTLTASHGGTLSCGQTTLTLTASATGSGLSYSFVGGGVVGQSGNSATVNAANTYTVAITGGNSCMTSSTAVVESNTATPTVTLSPATATLSCASPTVTLTATSGLTNYSFSTGQSGADNTLLVSSAGTYSVVVTATNGCTASATAVVESSTTVISASLVASGAISCTATSVTLTASPANLTYTFGSGATQIGATNQAVVTGAGTYSVVVSDAGGCSAVAQMIVSGSTTAPTSPTLGLAWWHTDLRPNCPNFNSIGNRFGVELCLCWTIGSP